MWLKSFVLDEEKPHTTIEAKYNNKNFNEPLLHVSKVYNE